MSQDASHTLDDGTSPLTHLIVAFNLGQTKVSVEEALTMPGFAQRRYARVTATPPRLAPQGGSGASVERRIRSVDLPQFIRYVAMSTQRDPQRFKALHDVTAARA